ncbi:uncharacterized protein LOC114262979 [Camellia sinensis]|uniref:uncharacterized protein LOC114262979 n=1 Tax=Camellia sinensis TaxID=4442 RepID=UPI001036F11D|nr:uncharacterized protein LOC114262979 [Camellia sinensis]
MALPSTTQSWMNSINIPNFDHDIPAAAKRDISCYLPLHIAILQGNWENASKIFENDPNAITARLTALSETPLLVAVKVRQGILFVRKLVELMQPEALALTDYFGNTALHAVAVLGNIIEAKQGILFVRKLVELMQPEALALTDYFGNTALHAVAVLGNIIEAKLIVEKNPDLPNIWNNDGFLPLHLAAMHGQRKMTLFLLSVTRDDEESKPYEGEAGATLMRFAINVGFYDLALDLLSRNPKLAWKDFSPLEVMAQEHSAFPSGTCFNIWKCFIYTCVPLKLIDPNQGNDQSQVPHHRRCCAPIFGCKQLISVWQKFHVVLWKVLETSVPPINRIGQTKMMHHQAIHLVKRICREVIGLDNTKASSILRLPFLLAAQYGIHEIVKEILDSFPDAITFVDEENHTAFHLAVMYRHEKVFKVMHQRSGQYKFLLSLLPDNDGNNMLHLVGYKARQQRLDFSSGAVLQMQRELQWFKVVEKFVLPQERKSKNCDGKTPLQIFIEEHKELMAYEGQWMMGKATSCTVAASLIATVVFAAAITVPGGSTVDGFPIFSKKKAFIVFAISDGLALVSALSTVLSFLSIFTSRYAVVEKFVLPQERKSKNCDGKTPLQIFIEEHKELMAYEGQWMMGMATSCTVAASLIATVVFAAAITVPGGSTVDGFPIFSKKKAFIVFAISDGLALVSALSTVLSFLSIFTSRYAVIDYLYALPMRLIIGLLALFLSVITMMTAFSATLYLVFSKENALILIPVATLACLPVALFATLQLPPLLNMIKSTYGPSIFSQ